MGGRVSNDTLPALSLSMKTETDLANHALTYLGEIAISSIDDAGSKAARVCKQFAGAAISETLRLARWNGGTKRATLSERLPAPIAGFAHYYSLPTDFLRLMEINGEQTQNSEDLFEIEGQLLATDATAVTIRYVAKVGIEGFDPLLQKAIALRLASMVAVPLLGSSDKMQIMDAMFQRAVSQARQVDAQESGARENTGWERVLSRSPLIQARYF